MAQPEEKYKEREEGKEEATLDEVSPHLEPDSPPRSTDLCC